MSGKYQTLLDNASYIDDEDGEDMEGFHQLQSQIASSLGKALTCECLLQYKDAVSLYKNACKYIENLWIKLKRITKNNKYEVPNNMTNISRSLYDSLGQIRKRTSKLDKFRKSFSTITSDQILEDLNITVENISPLPIKNILSVKKALEIRSLKVNKINNVDNANKRYIGSADQVEVKVRKRKNTTEDITDFKKTRHATEEDLLDLDEQTFESLSDGKVEELVNVDFSDLFLISQSTVVFLQHNCPARIYQFVDLKKNVNNEKFYLDHYLQIGHWIYPLKSEISPILKSNGIYFFPDFTSTSPDNFVALKFNGNDSLERFENILDSHSNYLVKEEKSRKKRELGFLKSYSLKKVQSRKMKRSKSSHHMTISVNAFKVICVGEVASGLGILLPKYFFRIVDNELIASDNVIADDNKIVDEAWSILYEEPSSDDTDIMDKMNEAVNFFFNFMRSNEMEYKEEEINDPELNSSGLATILTNNALVSHFISKITNSLNIAESSISIL